MKRIFCFFFSLSLATAVAPLVSAPHRPSERKTSEEVEDKRSRPVIKHWIQGLGGSGAIGSLRVIHLEQKISSSSHASGMFFASDESPGNRFRCEFSGGDSISGGSDGKTSWYRSNALGFGHVTPEDLRTWLWRSDAIVAHDLHQYYSKIEYAEESTFETLPCDVLKLTTVDGLEERWWIEKNTGHLRKVVRPATARILSMTATFGDFRAVESLTVPFKVTLATPYLTFSAERLNIEINHGLVENYDPPRQEEEQGAAIETILQRYLHAVGGQAAIDAVHSRVVRSVVEMSSSGVANHTTISEKAPNFVLREEQSPGLGETWTGFDGKIGWVNSEIQGFRLLKPEEVAQWKRRTKIESEMDLESQYPLRKYMGVREIDQRKTEVIALSTIEAFGGYFYFDAEKGLLVRIETPVSLGPKTSVMSTIDLSDFRAVDGLTIPFKTVWRTPTNTMSTTYESIAFNVPLDDALFKERRDD